MWPEREKNMDYPFYFAILLVNDIGQSMNNLYQKITNTQSFKYMYLLWIFNPNIHIHTIYVGKSTVN